MTLERLVRNLFDYAGMFPPASLDLKGALEEAAQFPRSLQRPHMIAADMVVKRDEMDRLDDAALAAAGFDKERHVKACLVGVDAREADEAFDRIRAFHHRAQEARIPRRIVALEVADERPLEDDLTQTIQHLKQLNLRATGFGIGLYYEPLWTDDRWEAGLHRVLRLLEEAAGKGGPRIGLKVRCAGPTALAPTTLAGILASVVDAHLPLKVTQGLHHPLVEPDRYDDPVGFLGLVAAHRLRGALGNAIAPEKMRDCLVETDPQAFDFHEGLRWHDAHATGDRLDRALAVPLNIGSCSIRDPDEDLVRLFGAPTA